MITILNFACSQRGKGSGQVGEDIGSCLKLEEVKKIEVRGGKV